MKIMLNIAVPQFCHCFRFQTQNKPLQSLHLLQKQNKIRLGYTSVQQNNH